MIQLNEEKLIPSKRAYYILSGIGLGLSILSISFLFTLDILWLNISLSVICVLYAILFIIFYLKREVREKISFWGTFGWLILIIAITLLGTMIFIGGSDDTNTISFLKILFTALDITPGIYILIKASMFLLER